MQGARGGDRGVRSLIPAGAFAACGQSASRGWRVPSGRMRELVSERRADDPSLGLKGDE